MEPGAGPPQEVDAAPRHSATSPLRLVGYAAVLVALAFSQAGGRMVADTKFDLLTRPLTFLDRGLRLWDPTAAFGQVQNQAYGYVWPMGPFFVVGHLVHLPEWAIQRSWWALLLCLAFFGVLRLAQRLAIGSPLTQVVAAFAYVLTPRITTVLGGSSIEVWPMALAPWVLLPLINGTERGSVRRAAATSALVVACCGGVNAIAVAAVLPLGVIWIVTRARGPRRWRLLGWWSAFTVLATFWWSGPLVVLGRVSPPFLDYIENATITTVPTDLTRSLLGISDWVAYFAGYDYPAGRELVSTPFLILDAAAIAALGIVGICLRGSPHQRFLTLGVLTGVVLVGLGYASDLHGFFAADRQHALDGALAPLRNLHKFDVVLRIPLVLGTAHALTRLPEMLKGAGAVASVRILRVATVLVLVGLALPWVNDNVAPSNGVKAVPAYWTRVADYLAEQEDGTTSLELPAAAFGVYTWGNVHDDIMQGLANSPWAVRNVVPLAQPGNVLMLDKVTRMIESGRPSPQLASFLATNGVGHLVVRNDLNRLQTGAPDPAYVRSVLTQSPGITLAKSFGPTLGSPGYRYSTDGDTRIVAGDGLSSLTGSVDVYDVRSPDQATLTTGVQTLVGDPGSGLDAAMSGSSASPRVLAEDTDGNGDESRQVLTDGMRRREMNFSAVRWDESATMAAYTGYRLVGPEHAHRVVDDPSRWETTETWSEGVVGAFSSSSEAYADAIPPLSIGAHPGAALDGDRATAWESARHLDPTGQWWQEDFVVPRPAGVVTVTMGRQSAKVQLLRISLGGQSRLVRSPAPGKRSSYAVNLPVGRSLRITAAGRDLSLPGSFSLGEVAVDDVQPQRYFTLPAPDEREPVDEVDLTRDPERAPCVMVASAFVCTESLTSPGEDGDTLARSFRVSTSDRYQLTATASLRRGTAAADALQKLLGVAISTPHQASRDLSSTPVAMVDGDPGTTWLSTGDFPRIRLALPRAQRLRTITMTTNPGAPASRPTQLLVRDGSRSAVVQLDDSGRGELPHWRTRSMTLVIQTTDRAFQIQGTSFVEARAGVSELHINGSTPTLRQSRTIDFPCGSGPDILIGDQRFRTRVRGDDRALVRGRSVPLRTCATHPLKLTGTPTELLALPTDALRVDSVRLRRDGATDPTVRKLEVRRNKHGDPSSVRLGTRAEPSLLTLPQNLNSGWEARLDGKTLPVQRVDGWKQGWLLPAGEAGSVTFNYPPAHVFTLLLGIGAGLVAIVLLAALPIRLHRRDKARPNLPPLVANRPGVLDLVVVLVAGGLLAGWIGLAAMAVAVLLGLGLRRMAAWGPLAGSALVVASLALTWTMLKESSWAVTWSQSWSVLAVALMAAALAAGRAEPDPVTGPVTGPD